MVYHDSTEIYLDNAATTQAAPDVIEAMMPYLRGDYANPGSAYGFGQVIKNNLAKARTEVARIFNCYDSQVIFTSGGSESNNMVFHGLKNHLKEANKKHILISAVEHDSVLNAALSLEKEGFTVELIPVTKAGIISLSDFKDMLREDTGLVSVMYVNNETGSVNPVEDVGAICFRRGILFHTDCVQAAGTYKIDVKKINCDFASISAHKIHGVKGAGALFVNDLSQLEPMIFGGKNQEFGLRGGTENVPGIIAMAKACKNCCDVISENLNIVSVFKQAFYNELVHYLKAYKLEKTVRINGMPIITPGKVLNLYIEGIDGETLMYTLDREGVFISTGSACHSQVVEPSRVLKAMGLSDEEARSSVRISFSDMNTTREISKAAQIIAETIWYLHQYKDIHYKSC